MVVAPLIKEGAAGPVHNVTFESQTHLRARIRRWVFLSPPARTSRNEVADEELLLETAIRHCCRPGHAGLGVSQAQAVQAALSAGERRGRRAARALFLHRLRRLRRGAA